MSRPKSAHRCGSCGSVTARWAGRCPTCEEWNTLAEVPLEAAVAAPVLRPVPGAGLEAGPCRLGDVDLAAAAPHPTGIEELDRVLGGGLVPG